MKNRRGKNVWWKDIRALVELMGGRQGASSPFPSLLLASACSLTRACTPSLRSRRHGRGLPPRDLIDRLSRTPTVFVPPPTTRMKTSLLDPHLRRRSATLADCPSADQKRTRLLSCSAGGEDSARAHDGAADGRSGRLGKRMDRPRPPPLPPPPSAHRLDARSSGFLPLRPTPLHHAWLRQGLQGRDEGRARGRSDS